MITVATQISYQPVGKQTSHIFTMISILFTILLCLFSVHITECTEIPKETTYTYNYDNFGDIFRLGDIYNFNTYRYRDIDTGYEGPHIGGAFHTEGTCVTTTNFFYGYIVDITTTHFCGNESTYGNDMYIHVHYYDGEEPDTMYYCDDHIWHYNYTWIPPTRYSRAYSKVSIQSMTGRVHMN